MERRVLPMGIEVQPRDRIDDLRVRRLMYRIPLTDVALVSGLPRWRVQQVLSRTMTRARDTELDKIEDAIGKLMQAYQAREDLLKEKRHEANAEDPA
jgi:hypothetical protein